MNEKGFAHFLILLVILIAIALLVGAFFFKDTIIQKISSPPTPYTTSEASRSGLLKTEYDNPFDEKTQYSNPFEETSTYKNPFDR